MTAPTAPQHEHRAIKAWLWISTILVGLYLALLADGLLNYVLIAFAYPDTTVPVRQAAAFHAAVLAAFVACLVVTWRQYRRGKERLAAGMALLPPLAIVALEMVG